MKLLSVIIPVYNVEQYLERCVLSVVYQTYHNLEILLIDDGSQDQSGKICDQLSQKYKRKPAGFQFFFLHKVRPKALILRADHVNVNVNHSNFAHRFCLCTLKIQYLAGIRLSKFHFLPYAA